MDAGNTKITIINKALSHIKQRSIASLAEQSEQARKALLFYDCARKSALRACDWHWARVQKPMILLGDVDSATAYPDDNSKQDVIDQFNYLYLYPPNCIRLVKVYNPYHAIFPEPYREPSTCYGAPKKFEIIRSPVTNVLAIACNLEQARCHYTIDIHDESQFDDMFQDALGWQLADELCMPLTADKELQQIVHAVAEQIFEEAMRKNGGESTEMAPRESPYEQAREGAGTEFWDGNHSV